MKKYHLLLITLSCIILTMCTSENVINKNSDDKKSDSHIEIVSELEKKVTEIENIKKDSTENVVSIEFEKIDAGSIPDYNIVMNILKASNLKSKCAEKKVDQLDIDLMFMKTASFPFDKFKLTELSDGSNRAFIDLFPEKELKIFYDKARAFLKNR